MLAGEMPAAPTRLDLRNLGRAYVLARSTRLDPTVVDVQGSDANLFVGAGSEMAAAVSTQVVVQFGAHLLETAEGEDLDRLVRDRYQQFRKGASPALVPVTWRRPTAAGGAGAVAAGQRLQARGGAEYVTTSQATFAASALTAACDARAVQAGKETQVGARQILRALTPPALFDASLTVTNEVAAAGGEPREDDDVFRERIRQLVRDQRRGTLGAIESGARTVPGVYSALAVEQYGPIFYELGGYTSLGVAVPVPARAVALYVADSSGVANAALARAVDRGLLDWRCAGVQVVVFAGLPSIVTVRLKLAFAAGVDTAALAELVRKAVVEYVNSLQVGQTLQRGALMALLLRFRSYGLVVGEGSVLEPAGDVVPGPGETLRTTGANVTTE